jgi:Gram-negative bacterial TonB protein C-terminal
MTHLKMRVPLALIILLVANAGAQDKPVPGNGKGTCPAPDAPTAQISTRQVPAPPTASVHYAGTVTVLISLSDTGYLCDVSIVKGMEPALDREAIGAIQQQVFQPIKLGDKAVAGSMLVFRDYWRGDNSDLLFGENANAATDELRSEPTDSELPSLLSAAKIDGSRYENSYFGVAFSADGADLSTPPLSANRALGVRLVNAVAAGPKRNKWYSISLSADPTSKYPTLKFVTDYLNLLCYGQKQRGAHQLRDGFPFVVSGVQFMGAILKQSDTKKQPHFIGVFTTARKGYFFSLEVTAETEQEVLKAASSLQFTEPH